MGEEAKQEEAKEEVKVEEKKAGEEKKEEKAAEEAKKEEEPKPPSPFVLLVDLHCTGCAKKIERSILRIRGVEGVVTDMAKNQVTIKGVVEPQAVCNSIEKKTKRRAKVLSPLPAAEGEPIPQVVASQVSGLTTVELNVNMHCEACADQLKRKILKMKGVRAAETELSSGKVTVTGTMDANRLVDYVYRRTKKQAKVVSQPEPEKPTEEPKAGGGQKEEKKPDEEEAKAAEEKKAEEGGGEKKDGGEEGKKEGAAAGTDGKAPGANEEKGSDPKVQEGAGEIMMSSSSSSSSSSDDQQSIQKMMYYYQYPPLYVMERIPPPQLFSDENPNACCIT